MSLIWLGYLYHVIILYSCTINKDKNTYNNDLLLEFSLFKLILNKPKPIQQISGNFRYVVFLSIKTQIKCLQCIGHALIKMQGLSQSKNNN